MESAGFHGRIFYTLTSMSSNNLFDLVLHQFNRQIHVCFHVQNSNTMKWQMPKKLKKKRRAPLIWTRTRWYFKEKPENFIKSAWPLSGAILWDWSNITRIHLNVYFLCLIKVAFLLNSNMKEKSSTTETYCQRISNYVVVRSCTRNFHIYG